MTDDAGTERTTMEQSAARQPFVVAIGASAGAVEALRTLFGGMSAECGATFLLVVHPSARHKSRLAELLQPYTELSVREVEGTTPMEPGCVLVIPPRALVSAIGSHLRIGAPATGSRSTRRPIDYVFRTVADAHGSRSIGVLLTGAGSDGAEGLRRIKDRRGLVIVQDPAEAEHDGMPRSAIDTGVVDLVVPLRDITRALMRFCSASSRVREPHDATAADGALGELRALLESRTGHDFGVYRSGMLTACLDTRMRLLGIAAVKEYLRVLAADSAETAALVQALTLNVTEFFGRPETCRRIEEDVLPLLFELKSATQGGLRAWSVGCATGEEAYSLAIELLEDAGRRSPCPAIQVFASDSDEALLDRARLGLYPSAIEGCVAPQRLAEFFAPDEGGYRVRRHLRDSVIFACHDVFKHFPFSRIDLIVCRRLLRDLEPAARRALLESFHYALEPHGVLVVDAEDSFEEPQLFERMGSGAQIYAPVGPKRALTLPFAAVPKTREPVRDGAVMRPTTAPVDARSVHLALLEHYAPASVVVDANQRVLNYSSHASRYVRLPAGEVTHDVVELVAEPLRSAVRAGLEVVAQSGEPWTSKALIAHPPEGARRVVVHVADAVDERLPANAKLVVFEEPERHESSRDRWHQGSPLILTGVLEAELDEASRRLRAILSEASRGETTRGAGDGRTELDCVLEDVETAKDEIQIVNEELYALHQENRSRLDDLGRVSADLTLLLESTGLATLFLDRELKIVRFTPPALEIFRLLAGDQGRPLADVSHTLLDDDLVADAARVLEHLVPVEREVEAENTRSYLLRMVPYRALQQAADGVAITLVDITTRKKAEQKLRDADRRKDEFIALLAHELRNPLAPISAGIEILKHKGVDAATAERVTATMSRQAAQLVRLIDDLLDVSRISSGRLELRKAPVALADIMRDAVATVRPLLDRMGHVLIVDAPEEPLMLDADAARLAQVLANLLNNAARYTPRGGRIELAAARSGDNAVAIHVQDNGYGIDESALPHVFEMFYQGNDPRSSPQSGLGIGLALAKSLVVMHGGTIEVASAGVDCGSEFTLRLPVLAHAELGAADADRSLPLGRHRVLVVDDNADAARTLAMLIEALGEPDVHVAFSGAEALPLAERIKPDTVFLDLKMADMDGYEVAQRLRQEPWASDAWLVALTGWGLDEHKRRTKDAGFDQHLTKPADRAELEAILARSAVRH